MSALLETVDPDGLMEFSVVFTDRSLNHMSQQFQGIMRDISSTMASVYNASSVAMVPGGGTYAMEAVARQFAKGKQVLVVRNGWFSYRWSQIIETGGITASAEVMKARRPGNAKGAAFAPAPIDEVTAKIRETNPAVVFAPHVETSAGVILPDDYIAQMSAAAHEVGALIVLDCIASGCIWIDMKDLGVDVLISAPQKGWSATPSAGLVMLSDRAAARLEETTSDSFAMNLKQWRGIMAAYENGGHAYHATMPTDGIKHFHSAMKEAEGIGFEVLKARQQELGEKVRALAAEQGFSSVAADGFGAPGVVVSYTDDPDIKTGKKFAALGLQIAAGVPLACDEGDDYSTFRLGLPSLQNESV